MSREACELEFLINHPSLFEKYENIGRVKVVFENGETNSAKIELPKTLDIVSNFSEVTIKIILNFDYFKKHGVEYKTIESNEPDLARESILLHELQHLLQAIHNRPSGISYFGASKKADARMDALRNSEKSSRLTKKEKQELLFYSSLKTKLLHDFFYYNDNGEKEARKAVRSWLKMKGVRYVDPLTEEFGIPIYDDVTNKKLYDGGSLTELGKTYLEPCAGNGMLVLSNPENFVVNELDIERKFILDKQGFKEVLHQDALKPFPFPLKSFDGCLANPPFGSTHSDLIMDGMKIIGLEQQIIVKSLQYVKNEARSAFIIGGHTEYDEAGRLKKLRDRAFLSYLFKYYWLDDVINVNGKMYGRQGTFFPIRIILIRGRKGSTNWFFSID
jgi:hypothetical protein